MVDFFKELEKATKHLDKIAKEWEPKKKTKKTPKKNKKEQTISIGLDIENIFPLKKSPA